VRCSGVFSHIESMYCDSQGGAMLNIPRSSSTNYAFQMSLFWLVFVLPAWAVTLVLLCAFILILVSIRWRTNSTGATNRISSLIWEASGIPTYTHSLPQLNRELTAARRYQRPLSVAVLRLEDDLVSLPDKNFGGGNGNGSHAVSLPVSEVIQLVFPLVGSFLQEALRNSDKLTYDSANDQYVILFAQTTKVGGIQAAQRLREMLLRRSHLYLKTGLAQFPVDGLTLEDLVSAAREACLHPELDNATLPATDAQVVHSPVTD
jgi:hypothetical protein